MNWFKDFIVSRRGLNTVRHGFRSVENGLPILPRSDLPVYRSRDGTQIGYFYANPNAPYNRACGNGCPGGGAVGYVHPATDQHFGGTDTLALFHTNPQFKQGYGYPYGSTAFSYHKVIYPNEEIWTNPEYRIPYRSPYQHEPRPDVVRSFLPQNRL